MSTEIATVCYRVICFAELTEEIALSKLASVDFDKLKASLVSIREQNQNTEVI